MLIKKPQPNGDYSGSEMGQFWDDFIRTFVSPSDTLAQWIMAIFTIAVVFLVWRTLIATQAMVRDTRAIGQNQLRPWVLPVRPNLQITTNTTIEGGVVVPHAQLVSVIWMNNGQSPAIYSNAFIDISIVPMGEGYDGDVFKEESGDNLIASQQRLSTNTKMVPNALFAAFQNCEAELIIFSRVDYAHALDVEKRSFTEITYRVRRDGTKSNPDTKVEEPNYDISVECSRISEA